MMVVKYPEILKLSVKPSPCRVLGNGVTITFMTQLFEMHSPLREAGCIISKVNFSP
jgi:hypothetical protein